MDGHSIARHRNEDGHNPRSGWGHQVSVILRPVSSVVSHFLVIRLADWRSEWLRIRAFEPPVSRKSTHIYYPTTRSPSEAGPTIHYIITTLPGTSPHQHTTNI